VSSYVSRLGNERWRMAAPSVAVALLVLAACSYVQSPDEERNPDSDDRSRRSDAALSAAIVADEPGCSGAVGVEGEVVWTGAYGVADIGSGTELSSDTVFDIGKISNQFTQWLSCSSPTKASCDSRTQCLLIWTECRTGPPM
jgi:CubicO group peptidase (beta-lactamase class C family)